MKKLLLAVVLANALTGCAGVPLSAEQQNLVTSPIDCRSKSDCDVKWSRAQSYIARSSYWKIRVATDTLIQTEGPMDSMELAYSSTRLLNADGSGEISIVIGCGNMFGCSTNPASAVLAFRAYLE